MVINEKISGRIDDFKSLCESHKVKYLYAFGSSVAGNFDEKKSDIDLLVEIDSSDPLIRVRLLCPYGIISKISSIVKLIFLQIHLLEIHTFKKVLIQRKFLFMTDKGKKYLSDILHAIELVEQFTESITDYNHFLSDLKTQSAVRKATWNNW
ncbi:MAG: nucleotidyltransferase domain-containing protein [Candidatus Campbellbacteria bacterium]|nr:nucleotidyltransferase domain-containing protein [Candidatus Campbellbacteria bacterium]